MGTVWFVWFVKGPSGAPRNRAGAVDALDGMPVPIGTQANGLPALPGGPERTPDRLPLFTPSMDANEKLKKRKYLPNRNWVP